jgi:DDRGK domain-containing protein 1
VVLLEDLSGEFKISTADLVNRIKSLEESGILNGVFDERGKYIYITEKEMEVETPYIF